tara:strand:+ start:1467 stop:2666 length:1200 start_codon:yes stop_codon:yes gene_type:complete
MKITPVILCGGSGTRLWPESNLNKAKQFIDFGGWCLFEKTLERLKNKIFDYPVISTNYKYLREVRKYLKKSNIKKYKIILEPIKRNTAPAILSSALIEEIPNNQPLIYFSADHMIEKFDKLIKSIKQNRSNLDNKNIFIFGIKPKSNSSNYGYFLSKKAGKINIVTKFIEKPNKEKAKKIIKQKAYWNSGIFFIRKDSIINNFKKLQPKILKNCKKAVTNSRHIKNTYHLNKNFFSQVASKSFDYAILEKAKNVSAVKLDIPWSDLGSWREISKMFNNHKLKYFNKKNVFYRPWGKYINIFKGKGFLVKELFIKSQGCLSLQKHYHRSEHWMITQGKPKITLNKKSFLKKENQSLQIPIGTIHRIQNPYKKTVRIIEVQLGSVLKETDIVRYEDIYNRI